MCGRVGFGVVLVWLTSCWVICMHGRGGFALGVCFRTLGVGCVVDFCHFGVVFVGIEFCNLLFYGLI